MKLYLHIRFLQAVALIYHVDSFTMFVENHACGCFMYAAAYIVACKRRFVVLRQNLFFKNVMFESKLFTIIDSFKHPNSYSEFRTTQCCDVDRVFVVK